MGEYVYKNDYEREETQQYEGVYTAEEIELNKKLWKACAGEYVDFAAAEELLKQGADPLGATAAHGWDVLNHVYGELVFGSQDDDSETLPQLTELFLRYGMNVDKPRVAYDGANSLNPLWDFAFVTNENAIFALKMLLDNGLSADSFGEFWGHAIGDFGLHDENPNGEDFCKYAYTWAFKMLLLGASYTHVLENDRDLQVFLCCDLNTYDLHNFRDWDRYTYRFDTSYCKGQPRFDGCLVHVFDKQTDTEVWTIGVYDAGRETLKMIREKG